MQRGIPTLIDGDGVEFDRDARQLASVVKILLEPLDLMHALMEYGDDPDLAGLQPLPVDEVLSATVEVAIDPELGWNGTRRYAALGRAFEGGKQRSQILLGLDLAPLRSRVAIDFVQLRGCAVLDPEPGHSVDSLRPMMSSALNDR